MIPEADLQNSKCRFDIEKIGDHICDPEIAEVEECCYDKGDCEIIDL